MVIFNRTDENINDNFSDHFAAIIPIWINSNMYVKVWLVHSNINDEEDTFYKIFRHRLQANPDRG